MRDLGGVIDDYAKAAAALAEVELAASQEGSTGRRSGLATGGAALGADEQVPIVNNGLRRGLEANRFKRQQKQAAA